MKKIICIILSILMIVVSVPSSFASVIAPSGVNFKDVVKGSWYEDAVIYCVDKGYFSGTSANTFSPDDSLTREQFVGMLFKFAGYDKNNWSGNVGFTDAAKDAWYSPYVRWARILSVTSGIGNGEFGVGNVVTREQFCTLLKNYADTLGINTSNRAYLYNNVDATQISSWAVDGMSWAVYEGIMSGTSGNTLSPKGYTTRAQAAKLIMKFDQLVEKSEACKHVYTCSNLNDATCAVAGSVDCYCSKCEKSVTLTINPLGHHYISLVKKTATCTSVGTMQVRCLTCGDNYTYDIPMRDHNYHNGICRGCGRANAAPSPVGTWYLIGIQTSYGARSYDADYAVYITFYANGDFSLTNHGVTTWGSWDYMGGYSPKTYLNIYQKGTLIMLACFQVLLDEMFLPESDGSWLVFRQ